ncbi:MAG: TetR/AcrR family transcriptional regulator [Bacteroidota bacterium]
MKRTTRNAAKTKREIIEKSAPVFNIHGYAGTKMQMIIDATGYQMGGIYRHFDSKMDLAKAVFLHNYESLIKPNLILAPNLNPKEKLLRIIENYRQMVIHPSIPGGCPILNTAIEFDDTDQSFQKLVQDCIKEVFDLLKAIFAEGIAMGLFQEKIDPQKEALFLFAAFEGAIMIGKITKSARPLFDIFEQTETYLEDKVFK